MLSWVIELGNYGTKNINRVISLSRLWLHQHFSVSQPDGDKLSSARIKIAMNCLSGTAGRRFQFAIDIHLTGLLKIMQLRFF